MFSALAHEQRRHILLTLLYRGGQMTAGSIAERFACSWPTTTRHLKVLQDAGLLSCERHGRERVYKLQCTHLLDVVKSFVGPFEQIKQTKTHTLKEIEDDHEQTI